MKHEIIFNGKTNIKNMSKMKFNVFCKSILDIMIEDKKNKKNRHLKRMAIICPIRFNNHFIPSQSERNFSIPDAVRGCLNISINTLYGIVAISLPARAAAVT